MLLRDYNYVLYYKNSICELVWVRTAVAAAVGMNDEHFCSVSWCRRECGLYVFVYARSHSNNMCLINLWLKRIRLPDSRERHVRCSKGINTVYTIWLCTKTRTVCKGQPDIRTEYPLFQAVGLFTIWLYQFVAHAHSDKISAYGGMQKIPKHSSTFTYKVCWEYTVVITCSTMCSQTHTRADLVRHIMRMLSIRLKQKNQLFDSQSRLCKLVNVPVYSLLFGQPF